MNIDYTKKYGRISRVGDRSVVYDNDGYMTRIGELTVSYYYGRIEKIGVHAVSYDVDGRITRLSDPRLGVGNHHISYDHEGRIIKVGNDWVMYEPPFIRPKLGSVNNYSEPNTGQVYSTPDPPLYLSYSKSQPSLAASLALAPPPIVIEPFPPRQKALAPPPIVIEPFPPSKQEGPIKRKKPMVAEHWKWKNVIYCKNIDGDIRSWRLANLFKAAILGIQRYQCRPRSGSKTHLNVFSWFFDNDKGLNRSKAYEQALTSVAYSIQQKYLIVCALLTAHDGKTLQGDVAEAILGKNGKPGGNRNVKQALKKLKDMLNDTISRERARGEDNESIEAMARLANDSGYSEKIIQKIILAIKCLPKNAEDFKFSDDVWGNETMQLNR